MKTVPEILAEIDQRIATAIKIGITEKTKFFMVYELEALKKFILSGGECEHEWQLYYNNRGCSPGFIRIEKAKCDKCGATK